MDDSPVEYLLKRYPESNLRAEQMRQQLGALASRPVASLNDSQYCSRSSIDLASSGLVVLLIIVKRHLHHQPPCTTQCYRTNLGCYEGNDGAPLVVCLVN